MESISKNLIYFANATVDIVNCLILLGIFAHAFFNLNPSKEKKFFLILVCTVITFNVGDLANWIFEGTDKSYNIPLLHIFTFLSYIAAPMIYVIFLKLIRVTYKSKFQTNFYYVLCMLFSLLSVAMGFLSCFPGFLYSFDANNLYHRTSFHYVVSINTVLYYLFSILYVFSCRKQISKKELIILLLFPSIPVLAYIPQIFLYGFVTLNIGILISVIIVYKAVLSKMKLEEKKGNKSFTSEFFVKQNVSLGEKLKRFIFYYGYSEGAIESVKQELSDSISYTMKLLCVSVFIIDIFLFSYSFFQPVLALQRSIYLYTLIISLLLYSVLKFNRKKTIPVVIILSLAFIITIYGLNIYKSLILTPDELPLLFCCILFIVPSIFNFMPHMIFLINFSSILIYMDLARIYKPDGAHLDSTYLFFLMILGIIIGYGISKTKIKSLYLSKNLDKEINAKTKQLNGITDQIVKTMVYAIETKDETTKGHAERVADYAVKIARKLKWQDQRCTELWLSAILHDVGKIGIPDNILKKEEKLTSADYEIIKKHTEYGENILQNLTYYPKAKLVARSHHERFDGTGYPDGLAGKEIPIEARIVAVADTYEAISSKRHNREKLERNRIIEELINGRSTQFDPELINIFLDILEEEDF